MHRWTQWDVRKLAILFLPRYDSLLSDDGYSWWKKKHTLNYYHISLSAVDTFSNNEFKSSTSYHRGPEIDKMPLKFICFGHGMGRENHVTKLNKKERKKEKSKKLGYIIPCIIFVFSWERRI